MTKSPTLMAIVKKTGARLGADWSLTMKNDHAELEHVFQEGRKRFMVPMTPEGVVDFGDFVNRVAIGAEISLASMSAHPSFVLTN